MLGSGQGAGTIALCREGGGFGDLFKERCFPELGEGRRGPWTAFPFGTFSCGGGGGVGWGGRGRARLQGVSKKALFLGLTSGGWCLQE